MSVLREQKTKKIGDMLKTTEVTKQKTKKNERNGNMMLLFWLFFM